MSVIAAAEFDDVVAPGDTASKSDGAHGGFGAARAEADFFQPRDGAIDERGELDFQFVGYAKAGSALRLVGDRLGDVGIGVAEQHRTPRADVVEILVAVDVEKILALAAIDHQWIGGNGAERSDRAVDAADENFFGASEQFAGTLAV